MIIENAQSVVLRFDFSPALYQIIQTSDNKYKHGCDPVVFCPVGVDMEFTVPMRVIDMYDYKTYMCV